MALHSLIENQTIKIDNHHSGLLIGWERNLHIHKRMNKGSKSSLEFRLYFADKIGKIEFMNQQGKDFQALEKEIRNAFYDVNTCRKFIDTFYDAILPIINCDNRSIADMKRVAKRAAKRVAMAFDLDDIITNEFIERGDLFFNEFKDKYVVVDFSDNTILVGDEKQSIINFK